MTLQLGDGNGGDYENPVPAGLLESTDDGGSFQLNDPALAHGGLRRVDDSSTAGRSSVRCR